MRDDLSWNISKDDMLKSAIEINLEKCEAAVDQIEIMVLELTCNFAPRADDPDIITACKAASSSNFPDETVKKELVNLKSDLGMEVNAGEIQKYLNSFLAGLNEFIICRPRVLKLEKQSLLFIIAQLKEKDMQRYKEIIGYILDEMSVYLERIDAIPGFLSSDFFSIKMSNKRTLFGNYVDAFLQKNELPPAEVLIELSAEKYEGSESEARIYVESQDVTDLGILDEIGRESRIIRSENRRMIRKMMEISKEGTVHLYAERADNRGGKYCLIAKLVQGEKDKGLYIKFFGYLCWAIVCDGKEKIIYERGQYILNSSANKEEFLAKIETLKEKIGVSSMPAGLKQCFEADWIQGLTKIVKEQKHGTAVILTNCPEEAKRLCRLNRGTYIAVDKGICRNDNGWNKEQLLSLTSIDGALFMDLNGTCMAIGVIVDGKATRKGDTGKGARYNSIVNYVRQKEKPWVYLGIIVSEDGMVELTCNFEPEE